MLLKSMTLVAAVLVLPVVQQQEPPQPQPKRIEIAITADGFSPATVNAEPNVAVELVFTRTTDNTCAKEVVVPDLKVKKTLPLKEPVSIVFTPTKKEVAFACGMNMLKGKLVIK